MSTNILITNWNDGGEDILLMSENEICPQTVAFALAQKGQTFDEVYPIKEEERQFYCFDPVFVDEKTWEECYKKPANDFIEANPKGSELYEQIKSKCE